jgi:hypothetical protein
MQTEQNFPFWLVVVHNEIVLPRLLQYQLASSPIKWKVVRHTWAPLIYLLNKVRYMQVLNYISSYVALFS